MMNELFQWAAFPVTVLALAAIGLLWDRFGSRAGTDISAKPEGDASGVRAKSLTPRY